MKVYCIYDKFHERYLTRKHGWAVRSSLARLYTTHQNAAASASYFVPKDNGQPAYLKSRGEDGKMSIVRNPEFRELTRVERESLRQQRFEIREFEVDPNYEVVVRKKKRGKKA